MDNVVLAILTEMVKNPMATKAWRTPISDTFNDNRFFNCSLASGQQWRPLVRALMDSDKAVVVELIGELPPDFDANDDLICLDVGRITSSASANIFANREYEMLLRSLNLRRISYALFAGEKNQYLIHLPAIQEKLVDLLRNGTTAPVVLSEVSDQPQGTS